MSEQPQFLPASSFTLEALAEIFTRSFEGYFYPMVATAETLARRLRVEQIDLQRSLVMTVGGAPAGQAMLGLRAEHAWCGGFGVLPALRGRGLAHPLAAAMIEQARQAGARRFSLEVVTRNRPAVETYTRAGFGARRDLRILEWRRPDTAPAAEGGRAGSGVAEADQPMRLLDRFAALHPARPAWQRDLPSLLVRGGFRGLAIQEAGQTAAYLLFQLGADGSARIEDLGAARAEQARALLAALQARAARLLSVNEPDDSPLTGAFLEAGFAEIDRQHELWLDL